MNEKTTVEDNDFGVTDDQLGALLLEATSINDKATISICLAALGKPDAATLENLRVKLRTRARRLCFHLLAELSRLREGADE